MIAREPGVVAGLRALPIIVNEMQAEIDIQFQAADGDEIAARTVVAQLAGSARDLLTCERPMLNLVSRLSGIATLTREFVRRVAGTNARIYDTRKTTPGWRRLEKYAVRCGGGHNHRTGLFDAILIKDNHLALAAEKNLSPADAVRRARAFLADLDAQFIAKDMLIEVEIERLDQFDDVLAAGPDIVLLDNMSPDMLRAAVARRNETAPHIELEASGGVSLSTVQRNRAHRRRSNQRRRPHAFQPCAGPRPRLGHWLMPGTLPACNTDSCSRVASSHHRIEAAVTKATIRHSAAAIRSPNQHFLPLRLTAAASVLGFRCCRTFGERCGA